LQLIENGHAYYCFCQKERLDTLADDKGIKKYDRHCHHLSKEEIEKLLASGTPYVIRQLMPEGSTTFHDQVYGSITIENKELEDQILIKSDGMPTYNFANVVDDHDMAITHVARGSEYLTSTPKYKLLYDALGWEVPIFVHLPLVLNADGQKISKRHGASSIPQYIAEGYLPQAIVNYAALLGWSPPNNKEILSLDELIQIFDSSNISKSPSTFDPVKFTWVNAEHIKAMEPEMFYELALPYLQASVKKPGIDYRTLAKMTQSRISFVKDCGELVDFIDELPEYDIELYTHKKMKTNPEVAKEGLAVAIKVLSTLTEWNHDSLLEAVTKATEKSGLSKGQILWPIRTALSGKATTPCGATEICELLGKDESLKRLECGFGKL